MTPVSLLMTEHRLIERMIKIMHHEIERMKNEGTANITFIESAVDFIKTYADRCHHGKEEDILFKELTKKKIYDEHLKIMQELTEEHKMGRNNVKKLLEAKEKYSMGDKEALADLISNMEILVKFYPKHIEKEDKRFFISCMAYFTDEEQAAMLKEMFEFDKNMIHEKYTNLVEAFE